MENIYRFLNRIMSFLVVGLVAIGFSNTTVSAQGGELIYAISFSEGDGVATFKVDMTYEQDFDPETHSVYITGSLIGWSEPGSDPDRQTMVLMDGETEIPVVTPDNTGDVAYKYFSTHVADGWDGGEWDGSPDREASLLAGEEHSSIFGLQPGDAFEVNSIAELRAGPRDGTVIQLNTEAVLYNQMGFRNKKYFTDATGGIHIDDNDGIIVSEYNLMDGVTGLTGTLNPFREELQFVPAEDPGQATSVDNKVYPEPLTLADIVVERQSQLVYIPNVEFVTEEITFANGTNYDITDPSLADGETGVFRTELFNADYIGEDIPTGPVNLVGWVQTRGQGDDLVVHVSARFADDFKDPGAIGNFSLTSPGNEETIVVEGDETELINITWETPDSELDLNFKWVATNPALLFSLPALDFDADEDGFSIPKSVADELLEANGIQVGESITIKWTAVAESGNEFRYADQVWTVTLERGVLTSNESITGIPGNFELSQNYPNPFNPSTQISYALPQSSNVTLTVYNVVGQRVATLVNNEQRAAGAHTVSFDAGNLASGMYIYRIQADNFVQTRKMMLVK